MADPIVFRMGSRRYGKENEPQQIPVFVGKANQTKQHAGVLRLTAAEAAVLEELLSKSEVAGFAK